MQHNRTADVSCHLFKNHWPRSQSWFVLLCNFNTIMVIQEAGRILMLKINKMPTKCTILYYPHSCMYIFQPFWFIFRETVTVLQKNIIYCFQVCCKVYTATKHDGS